MYTQTNDTSGREGGGDDTHTQQLVAPGDAISSLGDTDNSLLPINK